eukprot:gene1545-2985_t
MLRDFQDFEKNHGHAVISGNLHDPVEGLLSLTSPNRQPSSVSLSSHERRDDNTWLSSPFSQLETLSPGSTHLFAMNSPLLSPLFSPAFQNVHRNQTPSGLSSCPTSFTKRARQVLEGSPLDLMASPFPKSVRKGHSLFHDTNDYSLQSSSQSATDSPRSGEFLRRNKPYQPIDIDDVSFDNDTFMDTNHGDIDDDDEINVPLKSARLMSSNHQKSSRRTNSLSSPLFESIHGSTISRSSSDEHDEYMENEIHNQSIPHKNKSSNRKSNNDNNNNAKVNLNTSMSSVSSKSKVSNLRDNNAIESFSSPDAVIIRQQQLPTNISPALDEDEPRQCNCKMSKCLKLYCECFAVLGYCGDSCRCIDCFNRPDMENVRQEAVHATKERNNHAFENKVSTKGHSSGCNCKKSQCLKKYCECFEGGVFCGPVCKCKSCSNYAGSETLAVVLKEKEKKVIIPPKEKESAKKKKLPEFEKEERNRLLLRSATKRSLRSDGNASNSDGNISEGGHSQSMESSSSVAVGHHRLHNRRDDMNNISSISMDESSSHNHNRSHNNTIVMKELSSHHRISHNSDGPEEVRSPMTSPGMTRGRRPPFTTPTSTSSAASAETDSSQRSGPLKKRRFDASSKQGPLYEFFGPENPHTTKLTALKVLEHLGGKDFYSLSVVHRLWCSVAMDDALWEG